MLLCLLILAGLMAYGWGLEKSIVPLVIAVGCGLWAWSFTLALCVYIICMVLTTKQLAVAAGVGALSAYFINK